ncbi:tetratricopeptide repeat protein [Pseudolabrys sp. FHR47]|uniref:tetratricopeptide repeat protein n=1 Tax=Pseudolabrys sp. FHR47 TaxID=2562284 RepID=UPI0010BF6590|nr:tetratricopeptide repeat protein [Pseudolabrys sp. FHR47]
MTWPRAALMLSLALVASPALAQSRPPASPPLPPPAPNSQTAAVDPNADVAYGAYQRGYFLTAFNEASRRAQQNDAAAMTLLGELYANGLGVGRDDVKAAQWYKMAAAQGNRDALFALAMFAFEGRAGANNPSEGARLLGEAAKLGHPVANYNLGLLYLQGQLFAQDFGRAAELFKVAANAGNPEAQYALATMYKEGRGVAKDLKQAALLMARASIAGNVDAMVEFAIIQFNGQGTEKSEAAAAETFLRAARRGSPIAQNRLARILMAGRGMPADPVEAVKWHTIAKAAGAGDPELDVFVSKQSPQVREAADKAAKKWMSTLAEVAP